MKHFFVMSPNPADNRSLWGIAWMSFFWSTATVMVFTLLPTFLTEVLGASKTKLGMIEGVAVFLAFLAKVFSGVLSDYWKSRKPLILVGTFLSIVVKSMFAVAASISWIFLARSIDRFSKGVRSAPTDALIADLSPQHKEGSSYGLRYMLYTLGAVFGGGIAALLMHLSPHNYRLVFWLSIIPAAVAFLILYFVVKPPAEETEIKQRPWHWRDAKYLPPIFWKLLGVSFLLMLARFSEAFLTLRAKDLGWSIQMLPLLMVAYDIVNAGISLPIGRLADKYNRHKLLLTGILVLTVTNLVIISIHAPAGIFVGMLLAGLHMGMTQGLIAALIAETTLPHLRGTAFAFYYLTSGTAVLIGNSVAGYLSDMMGGAVGAFWGGAVFTVLAAIYLMKVMREPSMQVSR
ncbi:MAG: MFS transporter [Alphaproteobacteria bacterium]|nr:MFS transporter [Alphaproteobacteria bacterium]